MSYQSFRLEAALPQSKGLTKAAPSPLVMPHCVLGDRMRLSVKAHTYRLGGGALVLSQK